MAQNYLINFSLIVAVLSLINFSESAHNHSMVIGVILHHDDYETGVAITYAVKKINMESAVFDRPLQRKHKSGQLNFLSDIRTVSKHDSFKTGKVACELLASGVIGIFGPPELSATGIVKSTCARHEIPHIQSNWNPAETPYITQTVLNIHPDPRALSQALAKLVVAMHWKTYTVLYQNDEGLVRLQDVLKITRKENEPIIVRQLGEGADYRPLLKEIKANGVANVILDCDTDLIVPIFTQAKEVGLLQDYQSYILTSLDAHTIDYGTLLDTHPNITTVRLVDPTNSNVQKSIEDWQLYEETTNGRKLQLEAKTLQLKTALMYDAVNLFISTVNLLHDSEPIRMKKFDCEDDPSHTWAHGLSVVSYMKIKQPDPRSLTGPIKFDGLGSRTDFELQVVELSSNNQSVTGVVSAKGGYVSLRSDSELQMQIETSIQGKLFVVSSRIGAPYLMERVPKDGEVLTGNDRYEGYAMDLIDSIAKVRNFSYRFEIAPGTHYNSLIEQLLARKADLAICDLTITYARRTMVDFTMPFMTLGISILYSRQVKEPPNLFSFTSPLSSDVWLYMATAFLGVSFLMYVLARMCPADWENPHPCDQNPEELENAWDFKNCLWFTLGGIMAQGCDILPKGISTRMLSGMWWFFALILLSSYTANLAAFLTMERMGPTIESAEDLAKQSKIKYGAVTGGSTLEFFKKSNFSTYQRMWAAMESAKPSVFTSGNPEGVDRVLKGKKGYAFLMESTSIEYEIEKNCELRQVGGLLDTKGYGIAMPVNSFYRTSISGAVLKLQEDGILYALKEKWWKEMQTTRCEREAAGATADAAELDLDNVGGVFVVLFGGIGMAFCIATLEFLWNVKKIAVDEQMTLCEALVVELKFALNIFVDKKSTNPKQSEHSSENGSETKSIAQSIMRQAGSFLQLNVFNELNGNKKQSQ